jgi:hypothetical protein
LQGFKIRHSFVNGKKIVLMATLFNRWLIILLYPALLYIPGSSNGKISSSVPANPGVVHPIHVSVTEINHNAADRTLEISCKLFTDDFEKVLVQNYKTSVDLINPPDREAMEKLVSQFIRQHLVLKIDDKQVQLAYLGYERDNDAVYSYFQVEDLPAVKKIGVTNSILYELFTDQINLMHVSVGGKRKSTKLDYPDKETVFSF